jgi:hypothetical protein
MESPPQPLSHRRPKYLIQAAPIDGPPGVVVDASSSDEEKEKGKLSF